MDTSSKKQPFDIGAALHAVAQALHGYPSAALFVLKEEGHHTLFEMLVACIISIRTLDEVTLPTSRRLFALARTPAQMAALTPEQIDAAISTSTFHEGKAVQIHQIAQRIVTERGGELPCDRDVLLDFSGVGPKCANLALGIACDQPYIAVDVHVHRVTNRWGYVHTRTPEQTLAALEAKLPKEHWIEVNRIVMPFGKHICTGANPHCSTCPVLSMCPQIGVTEHR
jgi:endonuclease-3